jgi:hypothetical protein
MMQQITAVISQLALFSYVKCVEDRQLTLTVTKEIVGFISGTQGREREFRTLELLQ